MSADNLMRQFDRHRDNASAMVERSIQTLLTSGQSDNVIAGILARQGANPLQNVNLDQNREQYRHFTGWVYSSVRLIAQRIAKQRIIVARHIRRSRSKKGFEDYSKLNNPDKTTLPQRYKAMWRELDIIEEHPLIDILGQPNEVMTRWILMYITVCNLELTGRCHWWHYDAPSSSPLFGRKVIWPVPSHWIEPVHTENRLYAQWKIRVEGSDHTETVDGSEIIYFYYPDPANPLGSISPLQAIARSVVTDEKIGDAQYRAFINDIWPGMALIVGRHPEIQAPGVPDERPILTKDQRARTIAAVKHAYQGTHRANEPLILDGFIRDAKRLTTSPREMDFMSSSKNTKERVTQGYGVNPIIMGEIEGANRACQCQNTHLLSRRGWLRYDEIHDGDVAGTINPQTHEFEWQDIQKIHIYHFKGDMVRLCGEKIDVMVTPEHRMWKTRHIQQVSEFGQRPTSKDLPWGFVPASDLKCHDALLTAPEAQEATYKPWFVIPGVESAGGHSSGDMHVPMTPFLAFLGWFVSEGWTRGTNRSNGSKDYGIGIKQAVGAELECAKIEASLEAFKMTTVTKYFTDPKQSDETSDGYARQATCSWIMNNKRLWTWLRENCGTKSWNKRLPDFVFDLPGSQLQLLLDALLLGDGHHRVTNASRQRAGKAYSGKTATYFTTSEALADQVQTLAMLCGRSARRGKRMNNGVYPVTVSEYTNRMSLLPKHISTEPYTGMVWCVTVPNGLVITRRNGKPIISGNSAAAADAHVTENTINPKIALISETLTIRLGPLYQNNPRENLIIYLEDAVAFDPEQARADREQMLKYGHLSMNENRTENSLPPAHGGDVAILPTLQFTPLRVCREDKPIPEYTGPARFPDQSEQPGQTEPPADAKPPADGGDGNASESGQDGAASDPAKRGPVPGKHLSLEQHATLWREAAKTATDEFVQAINHFLRDSFDYLRNTTANCQKTDDARATLIGYIKSHLWMNENKLDNFLREPVKRTLLVGAWRETLLAGQQELLPVCRDKLSELKPTMIGYGHFCQEVKDTFVKFITPYLDEKTNGRTIRLLFQVGLTRTFIEDDIALAQLRLNLAKGIALELLHHGHCVARHALALAGIVAGSIWQHALGCTAHGHLHNSFAGASGYQHDGTVYPSSTAIVKNDCRCHLVTTYK